MEFKFEAIVVLNLEHKKGSSKSKHVSTDFNLVVHGNLNKSAYIGQDDLPTKEGSRVLTNVLVQGLIGNIHLADQSSYRESAEHLRYIISELERGFVAVTTIEKGYIKYKKQ